MNLYTVLYMLSLISAMLNVTQCGTDIFAGKIYNVLDYGAVGDGIADDTLAFIKAWNAICNEAGNHAILIPRGKTFLVYPINFVGPCKSGVNIALTGTITAPNDPHVWDNKDHGSWIEFRYINGINIIGDGVLDGRGEKWWQISCRYNRKPDCNEVAPIIIGFVLCKKVKMRGVSTVRSGGAHIRIFGSQNVEMSSLNLNTPATSPNTDGIHVSHATHVSIHNSNIASGDDCISFLDRTYNVNISYINCGPGHGISIGSLGSEGEVVDVQNITISHINFYNTNNGARIKTWQEGRGRVHNIEFSNINFTNVENPIIIDQHYGSKDTPLRTTNGIQISDVRYFGLRGTSKTQMAVNLNCSENVPCTDISMRDIELQTATGGKATSSCIDAHGTATGIEEPKSCLLN